eukprot:scaffold29917_cov96-Isochrysis_galbana.AAC.2
MREGGGGGVGRRRGVHLSWKAKDRRRECGGQGGAERSPPESYRPRGGQTPSAQLLPGHHRREEEAAAGAGWGDEEILFQSRTQGGQGGEQVAQGRVGCRGHMGGDS